MGKGDAKDPSFFELNEKEIAAQADHEFIQYTEAVLKGFDECVREDGGLRIKCSQCVAAVISGFAAHEVGCPNDKKAESEQDER